MKKIISLFSIIASLALITGCGQKETLPEINLVYYKLYESDQSLNPIFKEFQKQYPHINIIYKNFTDPTVYYDTILNEIAEGRGPDIMSVHNTWVLPNVGKLTAAPTSLVSPDDYRSIFVKQAASDNIASIDGQEYVFGIPFSTDNLALYYNQKQFEQVLPEFGKPANTWNTLIPQINRLSIVEDDNSIRKSGLALGRGQNILRSHDIFYNFLLQTNQSLYNSSFTSANLTQSKEIQDSLDFITSFTDPTSQNYSWDNQISDPNSAEKELASFIQGDTTMVIGYSYLYKELVNLIDTYQRKGIETIDPSDIKISTLPQVDTENPVVYSNYFTEVVSRNSQHPVEAWTLIGFMSSKQNLTNYYNQNFKPTSRRDLIPTQSTNRIYKPFIDQIGYTSSFPIFDEEKQKQIIKNLIDTYNQSSPTQSLQEANNQINNLIQGRALKPN